jgi:tetratricopeptide (TPR) repeat protein
VQQVDKAPVAAGVLLLLAVLAGGCATPQVAGLLGNPPSGLPERTELASTPFYPQQPDDYLCGPNTLATILEHAGKPVAPAALERQVYLPSRKGALQAERLAAVRRHGLIAYRLAPRLEDLLREIAAGTPVLVLMNLTFNFAPTWHYAVAIGYDRSREEIVLRSGDTYRLALTLTNFERTWARSAHWAMLALPPHQLPATAAEDAYVAAAVALERVAPLAARTAYATALLRWPGNLFALIGLGNSAYGMKDLAAAAAAYRRATEAHPQSADAWNNLAQALLELGRRQEALAAGARALALGGPRAAAYRETVKAIRESSEPR